MSAINGIAEASERSVDNAVLHVKSRFGRYGVTTGTHISIPLGISYRCFSKKAYFSMKSFSPFYVQHISF
jgi:hypothetical protein